jgi:hypothetical protein
MFLFNFPFIYFEDVVKNVGEVDLKTLCGVKSKRKPSNVA